MSVSEKLWNIFTIAAAALVALTLTASFAAAQNVANATSGSSATSGSQSSSFAGNSWSSTSNYKSRDNTPSVGIGGGSPSPRTCAANFGIGASAPGVGFGINVPFAMRGCSVERAFNMVGRIPGMSTTTKKNTLIQVACQDKYAGAALTATGQECLTGRYRNNRARQRVIRQQAGLTATTSAAAPAAVASTSYQRSGDPVAPAFVAAKCSARQTNIEWNNRMWACR